MNIMTTAVAAFSTSSTFPERRASAEMLPSSMFKYNSSASGFPTLRCVWHSAPKPSLGSTDCSSGRVRAIELRLVCALDIFATREEAL